MLGNIMFSLFSLSAVWENTPRKKINVYMIGDSTVAEYDLSRYPLTGWGMKCSRFFNNNVIIHNDALDAASTKSYLKSDKWKAVINSIQKGDYLLIQFGHNDVKSDKVRHTDCGGSYNENLKQFVTEAQKKEAIPILITPVRERKFDENGKLSDTHGCYPGEVRKVAKELNVTLIDLHKLTKPLYEKYGIENSKKLFMWVAPNEYPFYPDRKEDNTHFSEAGALEVCKLVIEEIKKSDLKLKDYLKKVQ